MNPVNIVSFLKFQFVSILRALDLHTPYHKKCSFSVKYPTHHPLIPQNSDNDRVFAHACYGYEVSSSQNSLSLISMQILINDY